MGMQTRLNNDQIFSSILPFLVTTDGHGNANILPVKILAAAHDYRNFACHRYRKEK